MVFRQLFARDRFSANRRNWDKRNQLWDISTTADTGVANQEYYEDEGTVDAYDIVGYLNGEHTRKPSSFGTDPLSFQAIKLAETLGAKRVLDVGCGAGFFRYAIDRFSDINLERYHGVDISSSQIDRAKKRFGNCFDVCCADELSSSFIGEFDFVHTYSVLNFMNPNKQMAFLRTLLASANTMTMLRFSVTEKHVEFCPQISYKNLGQASRDGKTLLSQIGFCLLSDIKKLVRSSDRYELSISETVFSVAPACNLRDHDGAVLVEPNILAKNQAAEKKAFGIGNRLKAYKCTISPKGIDLSDVSIPNELSKLING